ncbi:unnamed protein product [Closterium sp. Naga37s-1]|nr:unnamed protein product [Closterium sp. Naga37s-1]
MAASLAPLCHSALSPPPLRLASRHSPFRASSQPLLPRGVMRGSRGAVRRAVQEVRAGVAEAGGEPAPMGQVTRYNDSPIDLALMGLFRRKMEQQIGEVATRKGGYEAFVEVSRRVMQGRSAAEQRAIVANVLMSLLPPNAPATVRAPLLPSLLHAGRAVSGRAACRAACTAACRGGQCPHVAAAAARPTPPPLSAALPSHCPPLLASPTPATLTLPPLAAPLPVPAALLSLPASAISFHLIPLCGPTRPLPHATSFPTPFSPAPSLPTPLVPSSASCSPPASGQRRSTRPSQCPALSGRGALPVMLSLPRFSCCLAHSSLVSLPRCARPALCAAAAAAAAAAAVAHCCCCCCCTGAAEGGGGERAEADERRADHQVQLYLAVASRFPWYLEVSGCVGMYLEVSGCVGMCVNMCKLPTQDFFTNDFGLPLTMTPNFEDMSCEMVFGQMPPPLSEDPALSQPCFAALCSMAQPEADKCPRVPDATP